MVVVAVILGVPLFEILIYCQGNEFVGCGCHADDRQYLFLDVWTWFRVVERKVL